MRWTNRGRSASLEDMRGRGGGGFGSGGLGGGFRGGGMGGFPMGRAGKGGIGGIVLVLFMTLVLPRLLSGGGGGGPFDNVMTGQTAAVDQQGVSNDPETEELVDFVSFVFDDTQEFWAGQFESTGDQYQKAKIVLFDGPIPSGCGQATPEIGPHYCPADAKVYLDLSFFSELAQRFDAPGDFAQAYVIAHEVGHHVQNLLGTNERVRQAQQDDPGGANEASVRLELQADCYAGLWANSADEDGELESGDIDEGLAAAASVGDDRLQQQAGARVNPESWTHGSSAQRKRWFDTGYDTGDPDRCDTFSGDI